MSFETKTGQIGSTPELPWQVEGLLTVFSTVEKLNFRNVSFEHQKLTFARIFSTAFMCQKEVLTINKILYIKWLQKYGS